MILSWGQRTESAAPNRPQDDDSCCELTSTADGRHMHKESHGMDGILPYMDGYLRKRDSGLKSKGEKKRLVRVTVLSMIYTSGRLALFIRARRHAS
jgi:hypothetical protein